MKSIYFRLISSIGCLFLFCAQSTAQQIRANPTALLDFKGDVINAAQKTDVEGSVFYDDAYRDAILYLINGTALTSMKVKLNLKDHQVYYMDGATEKVAVSAVKRIEFIDPKGKANVVFENGYPSLEGNTVNSYYQVVLNGKATLLMGSKFFESDFKPFNSAVVTKRIEKVNQLYGYANQGISRLTKADDVVSVLADKSKEMSDYLTKQKLKFKKQSDFELTFAYYNTLIP